MDNPLSNPQQPNTGSPVSGRAQGGSEGSVPPRPAMPAAEAAARPAWQPPAEVLPPTPVADEGAAQAHPHGTGADHQPTVPLSPYAPTASAYAPTESSFGPAAPTKEKKETGQRRRGTAVAGLLIAAALVGGVAGVGGSYLGNTVWSGSPAASSSSDGPSAITVNNPGSVNEATAVATQVMPSTVTITVSSSQESGNGTGVVLSDDGYVLTNTHVVTLGGAVSDGTIKVTASDGTIYDAEVVGTDPVYDLAVIKLKDASGLTPIEFADSDKLNVGDTTVAVGAPLGLPNTVTTGIVSALDRSIQIQSSAAPDSEEPQTPDDQGQDGTPWFFDLPGQDQEQQQSAQDDSISLSVIQTDAAINPGNSGGPLVNSEGKLIGINVAIATAGGSSSSESESGSVGIGFSIPSNIAQRVADEIIDNGKATHGLLGASVTSSSSYEDATVEGAAIVEVTDGGAAQKAGLREGDVVTEFNGNQVRSSTDLTAQVRALASGTKATLTYVRDGTSETVDLTVGEL